MVKFLSVLSLLLTYSFLFSPPNDIQVKGIVHQRISEFAKKESLPSLTRSGCAYLMQVTEDFSFLIDERMLTPCGLVLLGRHERTKSVSKEKY